MTPTVLTAHDGTEDFWKRVWLPDYNAAAEWEANVPEKSVTEKAGLKVLARLAWPFKIVTLVSAPLASRPLGELRKHILGKSWTPTRAGKKFAIFVKST